MSTRRSLTVASILVLLFAVSAPIGEAAGRRGASSSGRSSAPVARSSPSRAPSSARSAPARTATSRPQAAPRGVARGQARYGYSPNGGGYYPYYPPDWGWGGYWGWGGWWGPDPYWGWPYWGWPYYYGPTVVVAPPMDVELPPDLPGVVETAVSPKSASLAVDGEELGFAKDFNGAWDALRLPPGTHVLEFSKEGYRSYRAVVNVEPGRRYRIERQLEPGEGLDPRSDALPPPPSEAPPPTALRTGFLRLSVQPSDAAVYLDGVFVGSGLELDRLHGAIPVAVGPHRIEVLRPGHATRTIEVDVSSAETPTSVEVALEPAPER